MSQRLNYAKASPTGLHAMLGLEKHARSSGYTERERAALAWTEAVTRLEGQDIPDAVFEQARQQFSETELVDLTLAIIAINGWNRLSIAFRTEAGTYQPPKT